MVASASTRRARAVRTLNTESPTITSVDSSKYALRSAGSNSAARSNVVVVEDEYDVDAPSFASREAFVPWRGGGGGMVAADDDAGGWMTPAHGARVQPGFASAGRGGSIARRDCRSASQLKRCSERKAPCRGE